MSRASSRQHSQRSDSAPIFDPFTIGEDHGSHSQSTRIIILEESGKVFCPLCLEKVSLDNITRVEEGLFQQYVFSLFEALDQHVENDQLRKIALTVLDLILKKRPLQLKSEHEFHNILRITHKIMNSKHFKLDEFSLLAEVISSISSNFIINSNLLPLQSLWKTTKLMLDYAESELLKPKLMNQNFEVSLCKFFCGLASTVKTYLEILGRFSQEKVSEYLYPLYENDPLTNKRKYYIETQSVCIRFINYFWFEHCLPYITLSSSRSLLEHERHMIARLFNLLQEGFLSSVRLDRTGLQALIIEKDCIRLAHILILRNPERGFRNHIRSFLRHLTLHYIEKLFGKDEELCSLLNNRDVSDIVEINHKNAMIYCKESELQIKYFRVTFYLLINCVALNQKSGYFCSKKVRKVLKCANPEFLKLRESPVLLKSYLYLTSSLISRVDTCDNIENFLVNYWTDIHEGTICTQFNERFCDNDVVLCWVYEQQDFFRLVSIDTMKYILERDMNGDRLMKISETLLKSSRYKEVLMHYLKECESAVEYVDKLSSIRFGVEGNILINDLSAILQAILHDALIQAINHLTDRSIHEKVQKSAFMVTTMVNNCDKFSLILDDQFIRDLFKVLESFYQAINMTDYSEKTLVSLNEFLTSIIRTNNPYLILVLSELDFRVLGFMLHCLADDEYRANLVESIADTLVAYVELDYPIKHNIEESLSPISVNISNWMLSRNDSLHILALKLTQKVLEDESNNHSVKSYFATALLHRVFINSNILHKQSNLMIFISLMKFEELRYNPLLNRIWSDLPLSIRQQISAFLEDLNDVSSISSLPSFESDESSAIGEEHIDIANILNQLNEDEVPCRLDNSCKIPASLFISKSVQDQHLNHIDTDHWEKTAYETTREADGA